MPPKHPDCPDDWIHPPHPWSPPTAWGMTYQCTGRSVPQELVEAVLDGKLSAAEVAVQCRVGIGEVNRLLRQHRRARTT